MSLPTPTPPIDPAVTEYWSAAAAGRLVLPRCTDCGLIFWYPRPFCPDCGSVVEWVDSPGTGQVYSWTVTRRGQGAYREAAPYVLAYVELDEGPRILTNVVDVDPDEVHIGQRVVATFDPVPDAEAALLRFRPSDRS